VNTTLPHSNPDSGPNTPPSGINSQGSSTETPPGGEKVRHESFLSKINEKLKKKNHFFSLAKILSKIIIFCI
jgi:hypothetical protein